MTPSIELLGLTISEPMTTATDYLVTAVAWWLGSKLLVQGNESNRSRRLWGIGFLWIGLGAFMGGTSHGFATYLDGTANFVIWKTTVYSIGLSVSFALAGSIYNAPASNVARTTLHALNILAFLVYGAWMINHSGFIFVIYHYVPTMTAIAVLHVYARLKNHSRSAPWMICGVLVTVLGAAIQQSNFSLHLHFNHNDLYHLVQVGGLVIFYQGVIRFKAPVPMAHGASQA